MIDQWGVYPGADARRRRRGLAERRRAGPGRAHPGRHRPGQCRPGRGHDGAGPRRFAQPRARRLDRPGIGYGAMFLILGGFALGSVALWLGFASLLGLPARDTPERRRSTGGDRVGGGAVTLDAERRTWASLRSRRCGVIARPWNLPEFIWAITGAALLVRSICCRGPTRLRRPPRAPTSISSSSA